MEELNLFEDYKAEFLEIMHDARAKLQMIQTVAGMERQAYLSEISTKLKEAQNLIATMAISARTEGRDDYRELVDNYKILLEKLKRELEIAHHTAASDDHSRLFKNQQQDDEILTLNATPTRALSAQKLMQKTTNILSSAERVGEEAIQTGASVLQELNRQREILSNSRLTLGTLDAQLVKARGVMNEIWTKMTLATAIKGIIVVLLIAACISVVYFRFIWTPERAQLAPLPPPPVANHTTTTPSS